MTVESSMPSGVNFGLRNKMAFGRINIPDRRISEFSEAEYLQPELLEVLFNAIPLPQTSLSHTA